MEIIWHGHSCFTIKGAKATVVTDPYGDGMGLKLPKLKGDVVTISHDHDTHNNSGAVEGEPQIFDWPGEYEKSGVLMAAVPSFHFAESEGEEAAKRGKNNIFHLEVDGFKICHLGDLGHKLTDSMIEAIGDVDILMVPVGGGTTIDHKKAHEVVEQIDPRIVIPMHYKVDGLTRDDISDIAPFLKEVGSHEEPVESIKLKSRSDLPEDTTGFIALIPQLG
jgi:L-ascorbate metabolism protein UlaG (beta-lactamase superfamily)